MLKMFLLRQLRRSTKTFRMESKNCRAFILKHISRESMSFGHFTIYGILLLALLPPSVDLNAADTGVQLKNTTAPTDRKQTQQQKQDGCNC